MTLRDHRISVHRTARYVTLGDWQGVKEVWFVLHGYSQLARHFIRWFEPVVQPGRLLVAPEALSRAYFEEKAGARRVGASWMTKEDREAEIEDYVRYLDEVADVVMREFAPETRVEVHGFSQGGATAARWVTLGRRTVHRLVVWGSLLPPDLDLKRLTSRLEGTPVVLALGERDRYVNQEQVRSELARLEHRGLPHQFLSFAGGHVVDREAVLALDDGAR